MDDHHHDHHHETSGETAATAGRTCCGACREGRAGTGSCASATNALLQRDILMNEVSSLAHDSTVRDAGARRRSGEFETTAGALRPVDQE